MSSHRKHWKIIFTDIVDYSKMGDDAQRDCVIAFSGIINKCLSEIDTFDKNRVILLPTGDGAIIAFQTDDLATDHLAFALRLLNLTDRHNSQARTGGEFNLHIGVSEGPLFKYLDLNGQVNLAGTAINESQRLCSFAGPKQIVVSEATYIAMSRFRNEQYFRNRYSFIAKGVRYNCFQYTDNELTYLDSNIIKKPEAMIQTNIIEKNPDVEDFFRHEVAASKGSKPQRLVSEMRWSYVDLGVILDKEQLNVLLVKQPGWHKYRWVQPEGQYLGGSSFDLLNDDPEVGVLLTPSFNTQGSLISKGPVVIIGDGHAPWLKEVVTASWVLEYSVARIDVIKTGVS